MATKKLMLNKARRLNDGTYPLMMQLLHLRKKRVIYSGIHLYSEEFDKLTGRVIPCKEYYRYPKDIRNKNQLIDEFVARIENAIAVLSSDSKPYTCNQIVELYDTKKENVSLTFYWQNKIAEYRNMERFGIAAAQQSTLKSVINFAKSAHIGIKEITPKFIRKYERSLLDRDVAPNTICYYMRNFKTIINSISKEGMIKYKTSLLFEGIKTSPRKTVKRAITRDELRALAQLHLENEPELELARDLFMFSFYTRGMSFVDIAFLQNKNLSDGFICYSRRKTKQYLQININQQIRDLIDKYASASQFIFPIISNSEAVQAYKAYRNGLRQINKALKTIRQGLDISIELTTYVARHSWATQAKEHGFPVSVISEGLGHCSENITQIYLKEFNHHILDRANNIITNL